MNNKINIKKWEDVITEKTGLIIRKQNSDDFKAILLKRMFETGAREEADYLKIVLDNPEELHQLIRVLTVKETYFFREPAQLRLLTGKVLTAMLQKKKESEKISILCAGCATGAEPYSIVIMIAEDIGESFLCQFTIWGIDIDNDAIEQARKGIYGRHSFRDCDPDLKNRYFIPVSEERFQIVDSLKNQVTFFQHNLAADNFPAEPNNIDVIFYRNVSIYFNAVQQKKIFSRLAGLLQPQGYLFMSATEIVAHDFGLLHLHEQDGVFYFSGLDNASSVSPGHALSKPYLSSVEQKKRQHESKKTGRLLMPDRFSGKAVEKTSNTCAAAMDARGNSITPAVNTTNIDELFKNAISLVEAKSYDEAIKITDYIIRQNPDDVRYLTFKAGILMNKNRFQEAESLCLKATEADPLWLEGHYLAGIIAMHDQRGDDALERFRKSVYLEPCCWQAHFYLGELQRQRGEKERAIQAFRRAVACLDSPAESDKDSLFMKINYTLEQVMRMCQYQINTLAGKG